MSDVVDDPKDIMGVSWVNISHQWKSSRVLNYYNISIVFLYHLCTPTSFFILFLVKNLKILDYGEF